MKIRNMKDFLAGLLFIAFGAAATGLAQSYNMGTAARMGPGYFPTVLGGVLAGIGVLILIESLVIEGEGPKNFTFRPLFMVLLSTVLFGILLRPLGLVLSLFALIVVSALGGPEFKWKEVLVLWFILTAGSVAVFVYGLQLQFPLWPWSN
jgi:hypothetical protein